MKAFVLVKNGPPETAFELKDWKLPELNESFVHIKVEAFGLNFADVMARRGMYRECPPLPTVVGYDVVGHVLEAGKKVSHVAKGDRVVGFTRFGGYAEEVMTSGMGVVKVPEDIPAGEAAALAVQYCTAYFSAEEMVRMHPGDKVLVQAAAGGVGTALVQLAKHRGCEVFGTAGSPQKIEYLKEQGVDHPINYREEHFAEAVRRITGEKHPLNIVFDSLGGKAFKQGKDLLGAGGRIVGFGASQRKGKSIISGIKTLMGFGFFQSSL